MSKGKPKVAFYDFADCEGCQLQVANLGPALIELTKLIDIVNFREIMSEDGQEYDVLVVEGSVSSDHDEERLKKVAAKAKVVIALGACATTGGLNAIKNLKPLMEQKKIVYGDVDPVRDAAATRAVDEVIKVDYYVHGCPIYGPEFVKVVQCALLGKPYAVPDHPVCVECKQKENICAFDRGETCVGPLTRAGCGAWCPSHGSVCFGCRGWISNPASDAQKDILEKYGMTVDQALDKFTLYCNGTKERAKHGKAFKN